MYKTVEQQKVEFDKKIAFIYGLATGLFIGIMIGLELWRG